MRGSIRTVPFFITEHQPLGVTVPGDGYSRDQHMSAAPGMMFSASSALTGAR